eukprot:gnl/MRDRNA2_/MRDRNA2_173112_c0_seq1.p1 gnl/MRDRNA2_/MRDRNA2_173112_c0~~gnl/MRDRNA2_/MRDRNA2_173112_c0_seq1.p1  ORF type:complete len:125 (+),score=25.33 gnl/MRDRNA2_/MRDRNA2_173112_c0_seq1:101-475(+)
MMYHAFLAVSILCVTVADQFFAPGDIEGLSMETSMQHLENNNERDTTLNTLQSSKDEILQKMQSKKASPAKTKATAFVAQLGDTANGSPALLLTSALAGVACACFAFFAKYNRQRVHIAQSLLG